MDTKNLPSDILIVGAGLCGLMTATVLQDQGMSITIVDKGRSVGGRLATRRLGEGRADHGAQFFTVRSPHFQEYVDRWLAADLVYQWSNGWRGGSTPDGRPIDAPDGYPRYAVTDGFNALAKVLATNLTQKGVQIVVGERLTSIANGARMWQGAAESGAEYGGKTLVLTAPVPQSLALLEAGGVALDAAERQSLAQIAYNPCLCGLFTIDGETTLPDPGALPRPGGIVSWMADNQRKGISPRARIITVHAEPGFSHEHYDDADEQILVPMTQALLPYLKPAATIVSSQVKRWRYAQPAVLHPKRFLHSSTPSLFFGGDAFGEPRVEGAARSGLAIGRAIASA